MMKGKDADKAEFEIIDNNGGGGHADYVEMIFEKAKEIVKSGKDFEDIDFEKIETKLWDD